jgi:hypothetical protein
MTSLNSRDGVSRGGIAVPGEVRGWRPFALLVVAAPASQTPAKPARSMAFGTHNSITCRFFAGFTSPNETSGSVFYLPSGSSVARPASRMKQKPRPAARSRYE